MKAALGWTTIIILSLLPVLFLYTSGNEGASFANYSSATHSLGEVFGLVGMTLFAITFVLSTRMKWIEDIFGGLDKVYIVHGIIGGSALMTILFHPIFLVLKFIPNNPAQAAAYILPSSFWSVNFGIIALLGMIALVFITLFTKMKYNRWKFTHEFLGLVFLFAVFHIFMVPGNASQDNIFPEYFIYASIVSVVGLFSFCYSLFIKNRIFKNAVYKIKRIEKTKNSFSIIMTPEHKPLSYESGQFIFVRFYNEKLSREAHPFSVASPSDNNELEIVVKKLGDYTSKLEHLKEGDKVSIEGPYGRFHYRNKYNSKQIWIAGGIGIVPFIGMAEDITKDNLMNSVDLYYSVSDADEFISYDLLSGLALKNKKFRFIPWASSKKGHLTAEIISNVSGLDDKDILICGSERFKDSIINGLKKYGVKKSRIHEEAFDFR